MLDGVLLLFLFMIVMIDFWFWFVGYGIVMCIGLDDKVGVVVLLLWWL